MFIDCVHDFLFKGENKADISVKVLDKHTICSANEENMTKSEKYVSVHRK